MKRLIVLAIALMAFAARWWPRSTSRLPTTASQASQSRLRNAGVPWSGATYAPDHAVLGTGLLDPFVFGAARPVCGVRRHHGEHGLALVFG